MGIKIIIKNNGFYFYLIKIMILIIKLIFLIKYNCFYIFENFISNGSKGF